MLRNRFIALGKSILLLLICSCCTACGNTNTAIVTGNSDEPLTTENAALPGESMIHDFDVDTRFQGKEFYTEDDEKYAFELTRMYLSSFSSTETGEKKYYLSQPYPVLNRDKGVLNCFLFRNEFCIGIVTFSSNNGTHSGGSFLEEDVPELTQCLYERISFVLLSDGFRLWLVSQERSCPLNLQEMNGTKISWSKEYLPFSQKLSLTEIELP